MPDRRPPAGGAGAAAAGGQPGPDGRGGGDGAGGAAREAGAGRAGPDGRGVAAEHGGGAAASGGDPAVQPGASPEPGVPRRGARPDRAPGGGTPGGGTPDGGSPSGRGASPAGRLELVALAGITLVAAGVRFTRIGHQSFWLDESYTVGLVHMPFGHMLSGVAHTESTPPLYYLLAWLWTKLFGTTEAGLRSLSALFGTIAVPVAWQAAREWFPRRATTASAAGLMAAALVAVNPFFVWYSQEARSYSLLVLTAALTILTLRRALDRRTSRAYAAWAATAALALLTHYFAAFLIAPEAALLLYATRDRRAWLATAAPLATGIALIPLAIGQRDLGHTSFIANLSLRSRVVDLPKKLVTGELGTPTPLIGPIAGLIVLAAVAYAIHRFRTPALTLTALAAAAAIIPIALALLGADYLLQRNVIAAYVPVILVAAAGLAAIPKRAAGVAAAAAVCAVAIVVDAQVATHPNLQRDDWRGAARALAQSPAQAVLVTPDYQAKPLRLYAGDLPTVRPPGIAATEVDVIANGRPPKQIPAPPPPFTERSRITTPSYVLVRYQAPTATTVTPAQFAPGTALLQMKGPPK